MLSLGRKHQKRTARSLLAVFGGLWLLASAAPCMAAQPMACPSDTPGNHCPQDGHSALDTAGGCGALETLNCHLPNPNPPSAALDIPAPAPMLLQTLPVAPEISRVSRLPTFARTDADPHTPLLNRKQSRRLI